MDDAAITKSFLEAIEKFAKQQMEQIKQETENYKNEQLKIAKEKAIKDAKALIQVELTKRKTEIMSGYAKSVAQDRKHIFVLRQKMVDEILVAALNKLCEFTQTNDYIQVLEKSLNNINSLFDGEDYVVYVKESDYNKVCSLAPNTNIVIDNTIKIGGIKGFCEAKSIAADDTLDSRLEAQRSYIIKNCDLKVV